MISAPGYGAVASLCAVTTTLSAAAGCVSALFTDTIMGMVSEGEAEYDLTMAMNGALGGLVGITANCSVVEPWAAVLIGLLSGVVYVFSSKLLVMLKIDDAVPVHGFCGIWGCIATGLFASTDRVAFAYGIDTAGIFYGKGALIAVELIGVACILVWCGGIMTPFFIGLNMLGMLRVDPVEEKVGLDISHHKGAAYALDGPTAEEIDAYETSHGEKFKDEA